MEKLQGLFLALIVSLVASTCDNCFVDAKFSKSMYISWGAQHSYISSDGENLQLVLDKTSGSAVQSKKAFLYGSIEMLIKLVPGNSAGTVTAYYVSNKEKIVNVFSSAKEKAGSCSYNWKFSNFLSSTGAKRDEIDFEFLGNTTGHPYIIHTNVYTQGIGRREQQFYPWFDPTTDFHNYTIHWNPSAIVWFIDGLPIRVFRNYERMGIPFPNKQGLRVYSTLWNADNWATRGGLEKINWKSAPFIARFRRFRARTCKWHGPTSINQCAFQSPANWWTSPVYNKLSHAQMGQMKWVRDNYMIYDYCKDTKRIRGRMPPECSKQQF